MKRLFIAVFSILVLMSCQENQQVPNGVQYLLTISDPESHSFQVEMTFNIETDTVDLLIPVWTPGYYQLMDYAADIKHIKAAVDGKSVDIFSKYEGGWSVAVGRGKEVKVSYEVHTKRKFVATSYVDQDHAYIVGANAFLYPKGGLKKGCQVKLDFQENWQVVTGLMLENGFYSALDYDILYDSPILIGNIEHLRTFEVEGVKHHFAGVDLGNFDREEFINKMQKVVTASADVIGHIPYDQYTFIAIGPGRGGIEHLNNTTVSFDGNELKDEASMKRMLNFLAHEHFHHYNVKRIRPFELGPFDYQKGSRTNMLWLSEGVTVYYEYLILYRAGITSQQDLLAELSGEINALQQNPGRGFQSLREASYGTWHDGPFGEVDPEKTISVYNKGAVFGFILDLAIRQASQNEASLDDVMQQAYHRFYLGQNRGFTEAEFQQLCEEMAGGSLTEVFSYIYETDEINYEKYLDDVGLEIVKSEGWQLKKQDQMSDSKAAAFESWAAR